MIQAHITTAFDLATGPLARLQLVQLAPESYVLLFTLHHTLGDAWSLAIWNREWQHLYHAACQKVPSTLPNLPVQYTDYAAWQRTQLSGERLEQHQAYWLNQLADAPSLLKLPTDYPRPAQQQSQGARCTINLPAELHQALQQVAQTQNSTLFMLLLSAFNLLLYRFSGQTDLCVGVPLAKRSQTETEHLIGIFVNMVVLRTQLAVSYTHLTLPTICSV